MPATERPPPPALLPAEWVAVATAVLALNDRSSGGAAVSLSAHVSITGRPVVAVTGPGGAVECRTPDDPDADLSNDCYGFPPLAVGPTAAPAAGSWWADTALEGDGEIAVSCIDPDGDEATVCLVLAGRTVGPEEVAAARLIAAAPDLLAACRRALARPASRRTRRTLERAVARAEGRTRPHRPSPFTVVDHTTHTPRNP